LYIIFQVAATKGLGPIPVYECVWNSLLLILCYFIFRDYGRCNSCRERPGLESSCFRCTQHANDFIVLQNDDDHVRRNNMWGQHFDSLHLGLFKQNLLYSIHFLFIFVLANCNTLQRPGW